MTGGLWPKIMLIGKNGQIGWELHRTLTSLGEVVALDRHQLDLSNPEQIRQRVREVRPNLIVNAAAYTAVDKAEEEPALAMAINGIAPGILAEEAKEISAAIVHYSTDYVFDGTRTTPYTEEDEPNPLNVYGKTKHAGERAIQDAGVPYLILRTSWIYSLRGKNFLLTILRLAQEREELRVVDDQIGSPTWSRTVAEVTTRILARGYLTLSEKRGIYHITAGGQTSWCGFARSILTQFSRTGLQYKKLIPITTSEYPTPARRPVYSVLSNDKLNKEFELVAPDWQHILKLVLEI